MRFRNLDMLADVLDGMAIVRIREMAETIEYRIASSNAARKARRRRLLPPSNPERCAQ